MILQQWFIIIKQKGLHYKWIMLAACPSYFNTKGRQSFIKEHIKQESSGQITQR